MTLREIVKNNTLPVKVMVVSESGRKYPPFTIVAATEDEMMVRYVHHEGLHPVTYADYLDDYHVLPPAEGLKPKLERTNVTGREE